MRCGNCGRSYSRFSPANNRWCATDKLLFCARCSQYRKVLCPICGNKLSFLAGQLFTLGLTFGALGLVLLGLFLPSMFSQLAINNMPTTSLEALSPSTHGQVKVEGTIAAGQGVVISGYDQSEGGGNYQWVWLTLNNFNLTDNNATVLVDVSGLSNEQDIFGSPQSPPGEPDGSQFEAGDYVGLIGTLGAEGNRTVLYATSITDHPPDYYPAVLVPLYLTLPMAVPGLGALGTGVYLGSRRLKAHEATLRASGRAARWKEVPSPPPNESVAWLPNPDLNRMRSRSQACGVGFAVSIAVVAGGVYEGFLGGSPTVVGVLAGLGSCGALVLGIVWATYRGFSRKGVARLGLAPSGLYVDYAPAAPKDLPRYFRWSDISELSTGPMASATTLVLTTSLGEETLMNLDRPLVPAVRAAFERTKAPAPPPARADQPLVLRATLPSSSENGRLQEEDVVWSPNLLRPQRMRTGALLLALQVPIAIYFVLDLYPLIGFANGIAIFFVPGIWGAMWFWNGYANVPARHGLSSGALHISQRSGEKVIPWADIQELNPGSTGMRIKTNAGFIESLFSLDNSFVQASIDRFEGFRRARAGIPVRPLSASEAVDWQLNPAARSCSAWFYLTFYAPLAGAAATFVILGLLLTRWGVPTPWLLAGTFAILPATGAIVAIKTIRPYRYAPTRIGLSRDGIRAEYRAGAHPPFLLREQAWTDVAKVNREGELANLISGGWLKPTPSSRFINFLTTWGSDRMLGPISPQLEEEIFRRLPPAARQDWKPAWDAEVGRGPSAPGSIAR